MPKVDMSQVDNAEDFSPLPEGKYVCQVERVEETNTRGGDEMWHVHFQVAEGEFQGRHLFDNLVFNEVGLKRVKCLCASLGLDVTGQLEVTPGIITGRSCLVDVYVDNYVGQNGSEKRKNEVRFAGFSPLVSEPTKTKEAAGGKDDDLPF